jgi:hypothetical protein
MNHARFETLVSFVREDRTDLTACVSDRQRVCATLVTVVSNLAGFTVSSPAPSKTLDSYKFVTMSHIMTQVEVSFFRIKYVFNAHLRSTVK